jgi:hypothetical protein
MIISLWRGALLAVLTVVCSSSVRAQKATTYRNVNLRRDPSASSPILEHLSTGTRLTLVDTSPDNSFYHVRTGRPSRLGLCQVCNRLTNSTPTILSAAPETNERYENIAAHVYHPQRLNVKRDCISVTEILVDATANQAKKEPDGVRHEKDGDTHRWLKVDAEFDELLNAGNNSDEGGNLVFEIVCRFPVTQPDAQSACHGYTDRVTLPPIGSYVRVVGRYVQDTFHAQWNEIHPVTSITVIA